MKKIILIAGALLLVGCGPSQKEKEQIAEIACAEIMATRNFEEARRIKILNEARVEVGLDPIIYFSSMFEASIRLGGMSSCIDYIIPPPPPPPKTKAQREAEEAAAIVAEEARLKREEEQRIAAAEADRKAKEKEKYIAENTKTTYLSCPSLEQDNSRVLERLENLFQSSQVEYEDWAKYLPKDDPMIGLFEPQLENNVETINGPVSFALVKLNKIVGDNPELNGYLNSEVHYEIKRSNPLDSYCLSTSGFKESVGDKEFCAGKWESEIPTEYTYTNHEESSSYGHSTLKWGYSGFSLDRVNLNASSSEISLGSTDFISEAQYQCEVVSKDTYDQKFQEVESKVKAAADAHRAELAEKESETPQI